MNQASTNEPLQKTQDAHQATGKKKVNLGPGAVFDRILDIMFYVCMVFVVFMMISICVDVTLRYLANEAISGLTEISTLLLVYMPFLGGAYILRKEKHVTLDTVMNMLGTRRRAFVIMITSAAGILISLVLVYYGAAATIDFLRRDTLSSASIRIYMWIYFVVVPIGGSMLFIQFIRRMLSNWRIWRKQRL